MAAHQDVCAKRTCALLFTLLIAAACCCGAMFVMSSTALAAVPEDAVAVADDGKWVTSKGKTRYKVEGTSVKGLVAIGEKAYLFDSKGVQKVGWRKVGDAYYYFKITKGAGAAMVTGKVVNGVKLLGDGAAEISNKNVAEELRTMCAAQTLVDKITKPTQSRKSKLRTCFKYLYSSKIDIRVVSKWSSKGCWWRKFANQIFFKKAGDCNSMGFAIAYLGNALGYSKCECVASGGHGWGRINGRVYDPQQGNFNVGGYARGVNYAANSIYVCKLNRTTVWKG